MNEYVPFDISKIKSKISGPEKPAKPAKIANTEQKQGVTNAKVLLKSAKVPQISNGLANVSKSLAVSNSRNNSTLATLATLAGQKDAKVKTNRPNWCTECEHGRYETEDTGSRFLWCGLADQAVLDLQKCVKGYWVKSEKGWPVTLQ